jgi:hypothetical protein
LEVFPDPREYYVEEPLIITLDTSKQHEEQLLIARDETELRDHYFAYWIHDMQEFFTVTIGR